MGKAFNERISGQLEEMKNAGKYKVYQYLKTPMSNKAELEKFNEVIVLCSNNYLGLSNNPEVIEAGKKALDKYGVGAASVRFICGTYDIHRELEKKTAEFLGMEASLSYTSCWNANTAVIPAIVGEGDCIISDELNHASIIDGCRLASKKVKRFVYKHSDMDDLEKVLSEAGEYQTKLIITDGVFSMEGDIANLPDIKKLADKYDAITMVDESHATGVVGKTGRGTLEFYDMMGQFDIITGTYGKALGGAGGGFVASSQAVIDLCIQSSRPSLFSNSLPPVIAAMAMEAIKYLDAHPSMVDSLHKKTEYLRNGLKKEGLNPLDGESAIVPIIVGETAKAISMARAMLDKGLYVTGFGYPVVPEGTARIRIQVSEALTYEDLDYSIKVVKEIYENS
ncbi:MAG: glycine C-acetyltransferase [Clostridia bacterium]|nr:glycine C-acetyltransferase [Clostridia bacterium]MBN2882093.1 glycine C-acetyltransferase [Clostridia bacterium]